MNETHLLFGLFRQHSKPVSNHAEDSSKVHQTHQDPEPHQRLVPVHVLDPPVSTWKSRKAFFNPERREEKTGISAEEDCTCHVVSDAHGGERDHNKVDGLQGGPALDVFEDDSRNGDEDNAASQDEEDSGRDSNFSLANLPVFLLFQVKKKKQSNKTIVAI